MRLNYRSIGELVNRVDERNIEGLVETLVGLSIDKCFIRSVANTVGTDLTKYKIVRKNDFAVSLILQMATKMKITSSKALCDAFTR